MELFYIKVRYQLKKGTRDDFYKEVCENTIIERSREEADNLHYEMYYPLDDADAICILEKWTSVEAQKEHCKTPQYEAIAKLKEKYVEGVSFEKILGHEI